MMNPILEVDRSRSKAMIQEMLGYVLYEPYPFVVDLEKCEHLWLATVDGDRFFDFTGMYASRWLGYNRPELKTEEYTRRLLRAANTKVANPDFLTAECLEYYRLIHSLAPVCMRNPNLEVYAVNSGAEANENMMKYLMNLHHHKQLKKGKAGGKKRFLYFDQAFHGRTVYVLNVTEMRYDPVATQAFHGVVPNISIPFPTYIAEEGESENRKRMEDSLCAVEKALIEYPDEIVAAIVEPIQGAGGHRVVMGEFFRRLSELLHRYDVFLGFDEVQTAGGQCGALFAVDLFDLPHSPQAVSTAKKFGNGVVYMLYPMQDEGVLDSTWGGTLSDMVRFCEEYKIVKNEKLIEQVPAKATHLCEVIDRLILKYPHLLHDRRGLGLYQGFSLRRAEDKMRVLTLARDQEQLLLLGAVSDTIRLRPVLDVTHEDIALFAEKLERVIALL